MTLKELSEHPERASEEDKKAFEEALKAISKFKEQSKYILNGITPNCGRSQDELAKSYYEETMLMAAVLESFIYNPVQEYKDINEFVFNYTDNAFIFDVSVARYNLFLAKLTILGLIEVTKEDKYNPSFAITKEGLAAIRQQNYSNLAQAAFDARGGCCIRCGSISQRVYCLKMIEYTYYGQSWTVQEESDAMWRIYSPERLSVRVMTAFPLIFGVCGSWNEKHGDAPMWPTIDYVSYAGEDEINKWLMSNSPMNYWAFSEMQTEGLFIKRLEFAHEMEVRVILRNDKMDEQEYIELEFDAVAAPVVTAEAADDAIVSITQATGVPGSATVVCTSYDGTSETKTYTIHFTQETVVPIIRATHTGAQSADVKGTIGGSAANGKLL